MKKHDIKITPIAGISEYLKRYPIPFIVTAVCPICGVQVERSLKDSYLSAPIVNFPFNLRMGHILPSEPGADLDFHEWDELVLLRVSLEPVYVGNRPRREAREIRPMPPDPNFNPFAELERLHALFRATTRAIQCELDALDRAMCEVKTALLPLRDAFPPSDTEPTDSV